MKLTELPSELTEIILFHLPPLSLVQVSQVSQHFDDIINSRIFFDRYCQSFFKRKWMNLELLVQIQSSVSKFYELLYLKSVTKCHPEIAVQRCKNVCAIGFLLYLINTIFLVHERANMKAWSVTPELCPFCTELTALEHNVRNQGALDILFQLLCSYPQIISLIYLNHMSYGEDMRRHEPSLCPTVLVSSGMYRQDFSYSYRIVISVRVHDVYLNPVLAIFVSGEVWIIWCRSESNDEKCCFGLLSESFQSVQEKCQDTFKDGIQQAQYDESRLRQAEQQAFVEKYTYRFHKTVVIQFECQLQYFADKVTKKLQSLFKDDKSGEIITRIDEFGDTQRTRHWISRRSQTARVSVLRYIHRTINNIFYQECDKYFKDADCRRILYLQLGRGRLIPIRWHRKCMYDQNIIMELSEAKINAVFDGLSVHNLPPRLWPTHVLHYAVSCIPTISRLVQLDIVLWTQQGHTQAVSDKVRQFLAEQTRLCGLRCEERRPIYPPLCGQVRYHN